jgi:hypothetical protein
MGSSSRKIYMCEGMSVSMAMVEERWNKYRLGNMRLCELDLSEGLGQGWLPSLLASSLLGKVGLTRGGCGKRHFRLVGKS